MAKYFSVNLCLLIWSKYHFMLANNKIIRNLLIAPRPLWCTNYGYIVTGSLQDSKLNSVIPWQILWPPQLERYMFGEFEFGCNGQQRKREADGQAGRQTDKHCGDCESSVQVSIWQFTCHSLIVLLGHQALCWVIVILFALYVIQRWSKDRGMRQIPII